MHGLMFSQAEALADDDNEGEQEQLSAHEKLNKLQADTTNSLEMTTAIMQDRELQISCRMLIAVAIPFRDAYLEELRTHHVSQKSTAEWLALRSMSSWVSTCQEVVRTTTSWAVLQKFGLRSSEGLPPTSP